MDIGSLLLYSLLGITSAIIYFVLDVWRRKTYCRLPPGPPGWPIVGNMFQLGKKPHESLFHLATKYGPLMSISLGMTTTVVVSSPAMAKEVLKTHGHIFAGRIVPQSSKALSHHKSSFLLCQYGSRWRMLRRISNNEIFSVKRLEALQDLRRDQAHGMIHQIFEDYLKGSGCVNIGHIAFHSAFNLIGNMAFGKDMFGPHLRASEDLKDAISKIMVLHTAPNLADYFPCLEFLDLQGVYRNMAMCRKKIYDVLDKFIEDRLAKRGKNNDRSDDGKKDLLDVLLDMKSDDFTLTDIRAYLNDIFVAGSDTTAETIEWAMAELIRNPEKLKRAQAELKEVVGLNRRLEESDTERLPYLRAVVKEVFRLHPVGPLLVPHRADRRCEIAGFVIPKHSRVLVNVWGMGRDPEIWKEPLNFVPERFIDDELCSHVEYRGKQFELIPFGAGPRMCVGLPLASRMVHLMLGSLIHSFEWAPPKGISPDQVDMTEKFGLALQKAVPLEAIATPRLDIFVAASDTTSETIEWAMAELIRNPEKLKRAQAELEEVVGLNRRLEESDTERLPYLRAVVKEVFRLHPAVPLLVPHRADSRCEIAGFVIPKHSRVLVNVWGMGRNPKIWKEPLKFVPERFIDDEMCSHVEYRGKHFELIPFGAGPRMCVGLPLASRMVHLMLGSLIHSFEWAPPKGMTAEQVDMTEKFGLALQKAVPLEAIATPRLLSHVY